MSGPSRAAAPEAPRPRTLSTLLATALACALLAAGCADAGRMPLRARSFAHPVPPGTTFDMARAEPVPPGELAARLAPVRLLFLGEHHTEPRSHDFQREVIAALVAAGRPVVVALEMFPPAADPVLNEWRQGSLDELTFLERAGWYEHWGFAWQTYRPLFEALRDLRVPLHGVNLTREERDAVGENRPQDLPPPLRALVGDPDAPLPAHDAYLLDTLRAAGHTGELAPDSAAFRRFRRVQRGWDRVMGARLAALAERQPANGIAVLLIGSGHLAYGLGTDLHAARASALPQLTVWDTPVAPADLDAAGRYAVPVGMADWVRVYTRAEEGRESAPSLAALRLEAAPEGVRVREVRGPASAPLGVLRPDDLVLDLNGQRPRSPTALRLAYEGLPPGETARITVLRGGKKLALKLVPHPAHGTAP